MELNKNLSPNLKELILNEVIEHVNFFGINIDEEFLTFFVHLMLLNPEWKIGNTCDLILNRKEMDKFIKFCMFNLSIPNNPAIETIKMQRYFTHNMELLEKIVTETRKNLKERLERLENEILICESNDDEELTFLYKKIVYYITLLTGLGNPTKPPVFKEAITALYSIFDKTDLTEFIKEVRWKKSNQLVELSELVTGIRIFNRDCNRGGQGIEDVLKLLNQMIEAVKQDFQKTLVAVMDKVNALTTALDLSFKLEGISPLYDLCCIIPSGLNYEDFEKIKDVLVAFRQYEITIRKFLAEVENIEDSTKELKQELDIALGKLHDTVRFLTAIPAVTVFPQFTRIAHIWCGLQNNIIRLTRLYRVGDTLTDFEDVIIINKKVVSHLLYNRESLTDAQRLEKTTGQTFNINNPNIHVLLPSEIKDFDKIPLQYLGFCAWKLVETYGGLFPGNPNMGVMEFNNKYYVFSSIEAAEAFAFDPQRYINRAIVIARKKPQLINLLQLYDQLCETRTVENLVPFRKKPVNTCDVEIQTDTHIVESKIDKNYMWNVWDLRRQALLFANLSTCKTHSVETVKSNFKNDVKIQTYGSKEQICQTKKDNYTNVPTVSNFIYGLRGRKDDKQFIIELTRPVDE